MKIPNNKRQKIRVFRISSEPKNSVDKKCVLKWHKNLPASSKLLVHDGGNFSSSFLSSDFSSSAHFLFSDDNRVSNSSRFSSSLDKKRNTFAAPLNISCRPTRPVNLKLELKKISTDPNHGRMRGAEKRVGGKKELCRPFGRWWEERAHNLAIRQREIHSKSSLTPRTYVNHLFTRRSSSASPTESSEIFQFSAVSFLVNVSHKLTHISSLYSRREEKTRNGISWITSSWRAELWIHAIVVRWQRSRIKIHHFERLPQHLKREEGGGWLSGGRVDFFPTRERGNNDNIK